MADSPESIINTLLWLRLCRGQSVFDFGFQFCDFVASENGDLPHFYLH